MPRFLLTASGFTATPNNLKMLRDEIRKAMSHLPAERRPRITTARDDRVFSYTALITVSAHDKSGANRVQVLLQGDPFFAGCVSIERLPERGYGKRRMGAELPLTGVYD